MTLCVASQRVFIIVVAYLFLTQSGNFWTQPRKLHYKDCKTASNLCSFMKRLKITFAAVNMTHIALLTVRLKIYQTLRSYMNRQFDRTNLRQRIKHRICSDGSKCQMDYLRVQDSQHVDTSALDQCLKLVTRIRTPR
jgi:hypothetical protein